MITKSILLLSAAIVLTIGSPVENEARDIESRQAASIYRLNDDVIPVYYILELTPYLDGGTFAQHWTFTGKVIINLRVINPVTSIVLHQNDLKITTYTLNGGTLTAPISGTYADSQYNPETDKWTIPTNALSTGIYNLTVDYTGYSRDDMHGFYKTYYMENKREVWMASTQFEQTEARRAFPCFDEPGFKALFKVSLNIPSDMFAVSNTRNISVSNPEMGRIRVDFDWTPPMSTYLLAFIVSKYDVNQGGSFGVYARPEAKPQTTTASEFGIQMLDQLSKYLGVDYYALGIDKMDMAAIPDFSAGAMENWGLLTYRETNILHYPDDTPSLSEQRIVAVIAHEQAHQWFGDSLTCKWWSETWLNEGFARYFQYFGTAWLKTDWDLEQQFVVEQIQQAMQLDSTDDTHPMTDPSVETKAQASGIFDNISYNKGASFLRMLSHHINETKFKETLNKYLTTNKDRAVVPSDLFAAIDSINTETIAVENPSALLKVSDIFLPWTTLSGFPLVTVERNNRTLTLSQRRFMRSGITTKTEKYNIPITFSIDSDNYADTTTKFFMFANRENTTFELPKTPVSYYLLNNRQIGYYRVNYDEENWSNIRTALMKENHDGIDVYNRAQIVDDLFNFARAGIVKYSTAIDIIRYIKKEQQYSPWLSAITFGFTFLSQRVSGNGNQQTFAWFIRDTMDDIYKSLQFVPSRIEKRTDIYNRANILSWLCKYGHEECQQLSKEYFENFRLTGEKVPKDHRAVVYCNAIREGNATQFDFLYNRFEDELISAEQLNILIGLACTKQADLVQKYLTMIAESTLIRPQDRAAAINNILNSNPEGPEWLYEYIVQNTTRWSLQFGSVSTLATVAGRFTTQAQIDKYSSFLVGKEQEFGATMNSLNNALTSAKANLEWDEKYMKELMDHLNYLKDSAPAKIVSIFVTLISFTTLYLFN